MRYIANYTTRTFFLWGKRPIVGRCLSVQSFISLFIEQSEKVTLPLFYSITKNITSLMFSSSFTSAIYLLCYAVLLLLLLSFTLSATLHLHSRAREKHLFLGHIFLFHRQPIEVATTAACTLFGSCLPKILFFRFVLYSLWGFCCWLERGTVDSISS